MECSERDSELTPTGTYVPVGTTVPSVARPPCTHANRDRFSRSSLPGMASECERVGSGENTNLGLCLLLVHSLTYARGGVPAALGMCAPWAGPR